MYTKEKNNGRLFNFILGIIAIIIIIFVIIWIINKGHTSSRNTKMFNNNLNTMQETANNYFNKNLPENVGEMYKVSLKEMYALGLSDKLYYGSTACDANESYISVKKDNETEYTVNTKLVCGDKKDTKVNTIKVNKNGTTVVDNTTTNNTTTDTNTTNNTVTNNTTNNNTTKNTTNNSATCPSKTCNTVTNVGCKIINDHSNCKTYYEYEYVQKTYSCPKGYSLTNDGRCAKTTDESIDATRNSTTTITDAKKTSGSTVKVYTETNVEPGTEFKYCKNGELKNGVCYEYTSKNSKNEYTYSCPDGYTKSGEGANTKCTKKEKVTTTPTKKTVDTYTCPSDYTKSGEGANTKCYKYVTEEANVIKTYTPWGNPDKTFDSNTKLETYTREYEKLIQTGSTCKTLFGTTTCVYAYEHYSRKATYSCPDTYTKSGEGVNTKCTKQVKSYTNPTKKTTTSYTCPSDYTKTGEGANTTCYKYVTSNANPTKKTTTTYYCPKGYNDNGTNCYKTSAPSSYYTGTVYSCPTGTYTEGTGANTRCYTLKVIEGDYYCENGNATLTSDHKCVVKTNGAYTCPSDYTLTSDHKCVKTTKEYTPMIVSGTKYIYTTLTSLEGYTRTGRYNVIIDCITEDNK